MKLNNQSPSIAVNSSKGLIFLREENILYCKAAGSYTEIYIDRLEGRHEKLTTAKSLKKVLDSLSSNSFVRVHHSFIVNLIHVVSYNNSDKNVVLLSDGTTVSVSRSRKEHLLERFRII